MATSYAALGGNNSNNNNNKGGNTDPYYSIKNDIQTAVERFTSDFDRWHDILENNNTYQSREFKELTESLKKQYKSIKSTLKELSKTIESVETNRNNFTSITTQELNDRKCFIRDMKSAINDCRNKMQSDKTREILNEHKSQYETSQIESPQERFSRIRNDEHIGNHNHLVQEEMKQQDVMLGDMHQTLKRLGVHANQINIEIESQTKLLDEVDEEMTITGDRLTRLTKKLDDLMGNSNSKKILLIVILIIILVVLIYFMF